MDFLEEARQVDKAISRGYEARDLIEKVILRLEHLHKMLLELHDKEKEKHGKD